MQETSSCALLCDNTIGSYQCGCSIGYTLAADNKSCHNMYCRFVFYNVYMSFSFNTDINECVYMMNNCSQFCNNTIGSYLCACSDGYVLAADNYTCNSKLNIYWLDCLVF